MQKKDCMCTAVFCGHVRGEKCPHPAEILVRMAIGTEQSGLGPHRDVRICNLCWGIFRGMCPNFSTQSCLSQRRASTLRPTSRCPRLRPSCPSPQSGQFQSERSGGAREVAGAGRRIEPHHVNSNSFPHSRTGQLARNFSLLAPGPVCC